MKTREVTYQASTRRFHPELCPGCEKFTGTHCKNHKSNVHFDHELMQVYEHIYLDKKDPYIRKPSCELKETKAKFVDRRTGAEERNLELLKKKYETDIKI